MTSISPATTPGVYITELTGPSPIQGVATSITAFVGRTERGPVGVPTPLLSQQAYGEAFGGLTADIPLPWCVSGFFANGGQEAVVLRLAAPDAAAATLVVALPGEEADGFTLVAASPGAWGNGLTAEVTIPGGGGVGYGFDLVVTDTATGAEEEYEDLSLDPSDAARYLGTILATRSALVRYDAPAAVPPKPEDGASASGAGGSDGSPLSPADYEGDGQRTGLFALVQIALFNLLCVPPDVFGGDTPAAVYQAAAQYAVGRAAMVLIDAPVAWETLVAQGKAVQASADALSLTVLQAENSAVYFPRLVVDDPSGGPSQLVPPCGAIAGVIARTDMMSGVWTSPAGVDAQVQGISATATPVNDLSAGPLAQNSINVIRTFPNIGTVVWGARTAIPITAVDDTWRYVQVRRTLQYIDQSIQQGLRWTTFQPDTPALRTQVQQSVTTFLTQVWQQGGLVGTSAAPTDAFSVSVAPGPISPGILEVVMMLALVRPAEFIVLTVDAITATET